MSLFSALDVAASGMAAQRMRSELLVENIANSETTRTPEGGPYRRRDAIFMSEAVRTPFRTMLAGLTGEPLAGVAIADVTVDESEPERRYVPGHPDADSEGYVAFPRISPVEDMVDLTASVRAYQANLASMTAIKEMIHRSIDLLR
jgi:flagellar basal-body rod protein FlgC